MSLPGRSTRNSQRSALAENFFPSAMASAARRSPSPLPSERPAPDPVATPIPEIQEPDDPGNDPEFPNNQVSDRQPDSDQDRDPEPSEPPPEYNLARSLELLASKIGSLSGAPKTKGSVKPRTPDVFDGSDPSKLDTFVFQCSMYVTARSVDFPDDQAKVMYALSYLKGNPLDWFQTELNDALAGDDETPAWFESYAEFLSELRRLFGPRDPVTDAMNALEALRYRDSSKATRYTIDFNRHGRRTGWNEQALARQYYKGLPDRLKDEIARIGRPAGLKPLQDLVATLDQRYWERQSEINRDKRFNPQPAAHKAPAPSENRSAPRSGPSRFGSARGGSFQNRPQSQPHPHSHTPRGNDQKPPFSAASASPSSFSSNKANSISDILGPDGKLKPEERKRRMDNNLCLRCGDFGHTAGNCHKGGNPKPKPKARAASVAPVATTSAVAPAAPTAEGSSGKA
jgi:hypothetical protein